MCWSGRRQPKNYKGWRAVLSVSIKERERYTMTLDDLKADYEERNPESKKMWQKASEILPGGISANVKFYSPFPLFMKEGHGAYLTDVDGHTYVDYAQSYGPLVLGHGREEIIDSMNEYLASHGAILFGTPHEEEAVLAEKLHNYYPSMESIRYTNSGTEATLLAIRTACAFTGRFKIAKFEGHYHGGYNEVLVSINPDVRKAGDVNHPVGVRESAGISDTKLEDTIILPFNNLEACKQILTAHKDEIAGVIMEPLLGGTIPATKEFMDGFRELTKDLKILLIFDEVKTGFRVGMGGAQGYYGIKPDLTTLGKIIGAGFPIGVLGGRKDIMEMAAPRGSGTSRISSSDILYHSGTYNGHPLILHLGLKTLEILDYEIEALFKNTELLKTELKSFFAKHGIRVLTPGIGSMFHICVTDLAEIKDYRDLKKSDFDLRRRLDYALYSEGIYNKPCKRYHMSAAHTDAVIDFTIEAYEKAFKRL